MSGDTQPAAEQRNPQGRSPSVMKADLHGESAGTITKTLMKRESQSGKKHTSTYYLEAKHKEEHWSKCRILVDRFLNSHLYDMTFGTLMFCNIIVLIVEVDHEAVQRTPSLLIQVSAKLFPVIYLVEISFRAYVHRLDFLLCPRDLIDTCIITNDLVVFILPVLLNFNYSKEEIPHLSMLRLFRLLRLVRAVRLMLLFPELRMMIQGLIGSLRAVLWGTIMIFGWLLIWSIASVQMIHPLNLVLEERGVYAGCERCPRSFESVSASVLTFTQTLIGGDSWGLVAVPLAENYPACYFFFLMVLTTVSCGAVNIIMGVVIDSSVQARKAGDHDIAELKERSRLQASHRLLELCQELDLDKSGNISLAELHKGMQENEEFADALLAMDIKESDLDTVFRILDADQSGDVDFREFVEQLHKMRTNDAHTMMVFVKYYVQMLFHDVGELSDTFKAHDELKPVIDSIRRDTERIRDDMAEFRDAMRPPMPSARDRPPTQVEPDAQPEEDSTDWVDPSPHVRAYTALLAAQKRASRPPSKGMGLAFETNGNHSQTSLSSASCVVPAALAPALDSSGAANLSSELRAKMENLLSKSFDSVLALLDEHDRLVGSWSSKTAAPAFEPRVRLSNKFEDAPFTRSLWAQRAAKCRSAQAQPQIGRI